MERKYAYIKIFKDSSYCIMYSWGAYYVGRMCKRGERGIAYTLRRYKTVSGAERYLLNKITVDDEEPVIHYGTEEYIKKGEFWR